MRMVFIGINNPLYQQASETGAWTSLAALLEGESYRCLLV